MQRREFLHNGLLLASAVLLPGMELSPAVAGPALSELDSRLFLAIIKREADVVEALIRSGADVNAKNEFGGTPFQAAAYFLKKGDMRILELLVSNGADVNAKDRIGCTPLHYAAGEGDMELVRFLVSSGADVHAGKEFGSTPLDFARGMENWPIYEYLVGITDSQNP